MFYIKKPAIPAISPSIGYDISSSLKIKNWNIILNKNRDFLRFVEHGVGVCSEELLQRVIIKIFIAIATNILHFTQKMMAS